MSTSITTRNEQAGQSYKQDDFHEQFRRRLHEITLEANPLLYDFFLIVTPANQAPDLGVTFNADKPAYLWVHPLRNGDEATTGKLGLYSVKGSYIVRRVTTKGMRNLLGVIRGIFHFTDLNAEQDYRKAMCGKRTRTRD